MRYSGISSKYYIFIGMIPLLVFFSLSGNFRKDIADLAAGWRHIKIDPSLPGTSYGTGAFSFADYDKDGDLDITISRREIDGGKVFWYQFNNGIWSRHDVGIADQEQLSAAVTDVNNDGFPDLVVARYWFENPKILKNKPDTTWNKHVYAGGLPHENHDVAAYDFDGDGRDEILCYSQKAQEGTLRLFFLNDPHQWTYYDISVSVNRLVDHIAGSNGIHGGFAPQGIGDLNNDGHADIVMATGWFRNPGENIRSGWDFISWPFDVGITPNKYGISIQSWVVDIDADGDNDIIYTDCDAEESNGYWIINRRGGHKFQRHQLPSPGNPTGSFHSLAVADFDDDGDLDIFSGEQEDPDEGMKPKGLKERGFFWENVGSPKRPVFTVSILNSGNPGWHDAKTGDFDGDDDIDIVSKIWNKDGRYYHLDLWENPAKNPN